MISGNGMYLSSALMINAVEKNFQCKSPVLSLITKILKWHNDATARQGKLKTEVLVHLVNVKLCEVQNSGLVWKSKKDLIHFCQAFPSPDHSFPVIHLFLSSCGLSDFCSLNQRSAVLLLLPCRMFVVVPFYLHVSSTLLCEQVKSARSLWP